MTAPRLEAPYDDDDDTTSDGRGPGIHRKRLVTLYLLALDAVHGRGGETGDGAAAAAAASSLAEGTASGSSPISGASASAARPAVAGPVKMQYFRTEHEAVLGWITQPFELYMAISPWLPKTAVVAAANSVARWVKKEEHRLFLISAPVF